MRQQHRLAAFLLLALLWTAPLEAKVAWKESQITFPAAKVGEFWIVDLENYITVTSGSTPRFQASGTPEFLSIDPATSIAWGKPSAEETGEHRFELFVTDGEFGSVAEATLVVGEK